MITNPITPKEFKQLREEYGLSQAQVARDVGIKRSYISQFENGRYQFEIEELSKLDVYLGAIDDTRNVDEDEIELGEDSEQNESSLDESLNRLQALLNTPIPKFLFLFDDEDEIEPLRVLIFKECLSLASAIADSQQRPLEGWDDRTRLASRMRL